MAGYYGLSRALVARELRYLSTVVIESGFDTEGRPWAVVHGPVSDMASLADELRERRGWEFAPETPLETFHGECFTVITAAARPDPPKCECECGCMKLAEASDRYLD